MWYIISVSETDSIPPPDISWTFTLACVFSPDYVMRKISSCSVFSCDPAMDLEIKLPNFSNTFAGFQEG